MIGTYPNQLYVSVMSLRRRHLGSRVEDVTRTQHGSHMVRLHYEIRIKNVKGVAFIEYYKIDKYLAVDT